MTVREDGPEGGSREPAEPRTAGYAPPGRPLSEWRAQHLPEIPTVGPALEHLIGSRTRARLLAYLLVQAPGPCWLRQIQREVGMGSSNVQRELRWFRAIGLVSVRRLGGAHIYHVDEDHPLYAPLRDLVLAAAAVDEEWDVPIEDRGRPQDPIWFR